jgi:hypothetical protein
LTELSLLSKPEIGRLKEQKMSTILTTAFFKKILKGNYFNSLETIRGGRWCPGPTSLPLCGTIRTD